MTENDDQHALRKWLTAGPGIVEVRSLCGDAGYLLNNMIARCTLAADRFAISMRALEEFRRLGTDLSLRHSRRTFYGRRQARNPFVHAHAVPAGVIREWLLEHAPGCEDIRRVLQSAGPVAVLLCREDRLQPDAGLARDMPADWSPADDPLQRHASVGIALSPSWLEATGAICR